MDFNIINKINDSGKNIRIMFDFSNLTYRCAFVMVTELRMKQFKDFGLFKHKVLNDIIKFSSRFIDPEIVICHDEKDSERHYWRHEFFPEYKSNRKKQESPIPKDILYEQFNIIKDEIEENLPWKTISMNAVEADDIIGVIATEYSDDTINVIVSPDKDFQQLLSSENVYQFCPMKYAWIDCQDPEYYLFEHVIRGDSSDGIPNIYSDSDTLAVAGKKQTQVRKTKINEMWDLYKNSNLATVAKVFFTEDQKKRFVENRKLIDLQKIPKSIRTEIKRIYDGIDVKGSTKKFWSYCNKNNLTELSTTVV